MIKELRKKFIGIAMISVTVVMVLFAAAVNVANYVSVRSELNQMLDLIAGNQGVIPSSPPGGMPGSKPAGPFDQETPYATRYFVLRYTNDGNLVRADLKNIAAVTEDDVQPYLELALKKGMGYGYTSGYQYLVKDNGQGRMMAILLDCRQEMRWVLTLLLLSLCAMAACIALVYVIVVLFSRKAVDPVVQSMERQKQFITDAGHELKTPITVIATSLKVLEMETGKQKWIDKAAAQTEKLKDLVNSLVTLSRMDEEESPLHPENFPVSDALAEAAESFRDFAAEKGHPLDVKIQPGLTYCGDEYAIRQLASILLDNAIKYALPDSPVTFSLEKGRKGVVIRTENACGEMDPKTLPKLFDRFYRPDQSRTSKTGGVRHWAFHCPEHRRRAQRLHSGGAFGGKPHPLYGGAEVGGQHADNAVRHGSRRGAGSAPRHSAGGVASLRQVLRINGEIRGEKGFLEFRTAVERDGKRGLAQRRQLFQRAV